MFEVSITLGNILTIVSFLGGGAFFIVSMRGSISENARISDIRFGLVDLSIAEFKGEIQKVNEILVKLALSDGRQNTSDERLLMQGKRIDTLQLEAKELKDELHQLRVNHARS